MQGIESDSFFVMGIKMEIAYFGSNVNARSWSQGLILPNDQN
jgi:hypothetical protein